MAEEPGKREPATELRERLAENIRRLAAERGISLNTLADLSGYSRSQFFEIMACRATASIDFVWYVALALEVAPSDLLATS